MNKKSPRNRRRQQHLALKSGRSANRCRRPRSDAGAGVAECRGNGEGGKSRRSDNHDGGCISTATSRIGIEEGALLKGKIDTESPGPISEIAWADFIMDGTFRGSIQVTQKNEKNGQTATYEPSRPKTKQTEPSTCARSSESYG